MRKVQFANALIRTDCGGRCMFLIEKKIYFLLVVLLSKAKLEKGKGNLSTLSLSDKHITF